MTNDSQIRVLFPVDEAYPLYKIGGLGDVGGSLPLAVSKLGVDVRVALPKHPEVTLTNPSKVLEYQVTYDKELLPVTVWLTQLGQSSVPVYVFEENKYLSAHTDASDNHADKFAVFSLVVAEFVGKGVFDPHVIHLHDWHTALIPVILEHRKDPLKVASMITIHNLAYQGNTNTDVISKLAISAETCEILKWDREDHYYNLMLQGILHSDLIVPVSPTYAQEILTPEYGEGLHEHLLSRKDRVKGVVNGLDYGVFDPAHDPHLYTQYQSHQLTDGKRSNREQLLAELTIADDPSKPLLGFVGRVDPKQKGIQLLIEWLATRYPQLGGVPFVFLGTGDSRLESSLHQVSEQYPQVRIVTEYNERLAARIYAASDFVLIPSNFEPCGLVQLIGMRYGAIPVARATGGLKDTIEHGVTGFLYEQQNLDAFVTGLNEALEVYQDKQRFVSMQQRAMAQDFSWDRSAHEYLRLYHELLVL